MGNIQDLEQHLHSLAAYHDIELTFNTIMPSMLGFSQPFTRRVLGPDIRDETAYAAVLHEMGHCVAPGGVNQQRLNLRIGQDIDLEQKIDEEYAAWQWAESNALRWTSEMQRTREYAFGTYIKELDKQRRRAA